MFLEYALKGHREAIAFCQTLFRISQVWDDLIDKDKPVNDGEINLAFWDALITIHENGFFLRNQLELTALMRQYITDWQDANTMERGSDHDRSIAFVLRDAIGAVVGQCAYLVGGYDWLREISPKIRDHIFEDTLEQYKSALEQKP